MDLTETFGKAKEASLKINFLTDEVIHNVLYDIAETTIKNTDILLIENKKDLDVMSPQNPKYDRLKLTKERISAIASDMKNVADLPSPLGKIFYEDIRPNGMKIQKITIPFGVIGIIYESRPNVSFDVFSICFKSGNACILKGSKDAHNSNKAIVKIIKEILSNHNIDDAACTLLPADREATAELMKARDYVDLLIPRGSANLINFVREHAQIPVIETGAGVCHVYFDKDGDIQKGTAIINNAKTRRVSVCNALDCLIINESRLRDLPELCKNLAKSNVTIYADAKAFTFLIGNYPGKLLQKAANEHYGKEFLDYKMSIKTVPDINEALSHIKRYSSKHSECIVSENEDTCNLFLKAVDAACVYSNVATSFTDGGQFGLGAEIGISTQKLHPRGPMSIKEMTTYKWIITGDGQIREK